MNNFTTLITSIYQSNLRYILFVIVQIFLSCPYGIGQVIFQNPSFEGPPGGSSAPPGWSICSGTPDVQPSFFGTTQIPSDGNTYLGFHHDESVSAVFPNGIGICSGVQFNMDISIVPLDVPGNGTWVNNNMGVNPGYLCIYGGYGPCDFSELLWQSELLSNVLTWETIQIQFTSTENFTHLNFAPCVNSPGNWTYFGIDNIQNVTNAPLPVQVGPDQSICTGQLVNLNASLTGLSLIHI